MIKRNLRAEVARLKSEVTEMFGDFCPHHPDALFLLFEADGHLRTSNLTPCEHCNRARAVHTLSFLGTSADELPDKPLYIPDEWLETFDKTKGKGIKVYLNVDFDRFLRTGT